MADIIIVLILIVIAVFAIKQTKKHMHGDENNEDQRYDL